MKQFYMTVYPYLYELFLFDPNIFLDFQVFELENTKIVYSKYKHFNPKDDGLNNVRRRKYTYFQTVIDQYNIISNHYMSYPSLIKLIRYNINLQKMFKEQVPIDILD